MSDRKRAAENQLSRDDGDRDDYNAEEFATEPQIASPEELAKRRIVKVRRDVTASSGGASTGGFFKGVAGAPAPTAGAGAPSFGFGAPKKEDGETKVSPVSFGFGAPATKDGEAKPAAPSFSFGAPASGEPPKFSFNFGAPATATPAAAANGGAAPPSFSFGFAPKAPATESKADGEKKEDADATAQKAPEPGKFLFGTNTGFNFSKAVNTFSEAQKKISEQQATKTEGEASATANADATEGDEADDEDAPKLFAGASAIVSSAGEVLANGPSKLYIFEKEGKSWKEHGQGEAKVKKDTVPVEEDGEKKEKTVYRLMVRDGYSLNAVVSKKAFILSKEAEKHIIFSVGTEEAVDTYLLKFTGPAAEINAKKVTEELKKVLEATA